MNMEDARITLNHRQAQGKIPRFTVETTPTGNQFTCTAGSPYFISRTANSKKLAYLAVCTAVINVTQLSIHDYLKHRKMTLEITALNPLMLTANLKIFHPDEAAPVLQTTLRAMELSEFSDKVSEILTYSHVRESDATFNSRSRSPGPFCT